MEESKTDISKINKRYTLFPIIYSEIYDLYKKMRDSFWTPQEIDLEQDIKDWKRLTNNEKHYVTHILAFFAASDGIVMDNLAENFCKELDIPEVQSAYAMQNSIESIHSETYSILIDSYIGDIELKNKLFNSINTIPCVNKKANWAIKWMNEKTEYPIRLIAFAAVEGIFFSSSFCGIFWLKKRGLMDGLCFSNELISRDEGMHTDLAVLLYNILDKINELEGTNYKKVSEDIAHKIIKDAVDIEKEFSTESISCDLIGMKLKHMKQYIEFCADRLLAQFGFNKLYNVSNPFKFMELISLRNKQNFFEKKVSEYTKIDLSKEKLVYDDDF